MESNDGREQAREHGVDASKNLACTVRFAHASLAPFSIAQAHSDANSSASRS
jgi:hypothetical protein